MCITTYKVFSFLFQLETVIQQEIEQATQKTEGAPPIPPSSLEIPALRNGKVLGQPSLPEPTEPPPPPPISNVWENGFAVNGEIPQTSQDGEPIYEAVLPRDEAETVPPPPPPLPNGTAPVTSVVNKTVLRPKSPGVERIQRTSMMLDRVPSPGSGIRTPRRAVSPACSSPRQSRPSSRGSSVSGVCCFFLAFETIKQKPECDFYKIT